MITIAANAMNIAARPSRFRYVQKVRWTQAARRSRKQSSPWALDDRDRLIECCKSLLRLFSRSSCSRLGKRKKWQGGLSAGISSVFELMFKLDSYWQFPDTRLPVVNLISPRSTSSGAWQCSGICPLSCCALADRLELLCDWFDTQGVM